ncbi:unnamed protein product [Ceutorhynchus assimilis]|uniref:F-box domain-containing protein n=1 Tax=Ceutorhynchus assimilis TaxID=467358 RepID=A0A9N9QPZ1_9CUCU|nr:unnamed protein product [Ceutorhynchus assimilis]
MSRLRGSRNPSLFLESVRRQIPKTHISPTENFDFGEALTRVYPILDLIFDYLPADDLKSCLEVSQSWGAAAQYILAKRRAPSWFTCYKKTKDLDEISCSPNLHYDNAEIGIIFYNSCVFKVHGYVRLQKQLLAVDMTVSEYFKEDLLPKSVDYCLLAVHRTISCFSNGRTREEIEYRGSIFDGVFIPKIPSVRTLMFECNPRINPLVKTKNNSLLRPHEETKCLLIFSRSKITLYLTALLDCLLQDSNSVAIGGGIIKTVKTVQHNTKVNPIHQAVCIAFLKDKSLENFNAYSCCIEDPDLSKDEFTVKLVHFRRNIDLKYHSLAFRIACVSKFDGLMELEAFQKVFPDVPLASIDARGEFGLNSYPNAVASEQGSKQEEKIQESKFSHLTHEYSSVYVIITWD